MSNFWTLFGYGVAGLFALWLGCKVAADTIFSSYYGHKTKFVSTVLFAASEAADKFTAKIKEKTKN